MFWEAIASGLNTLTYWQTYVSALLFLLLSIGPLILISITMSSAGTAAGAVGCSSMLVIPFLQTFALVIFVLTLAPIMLGLSSSAAWSFPWMLVLEEPWFMTKVVGKLLFAAIILTFIPLLGRMQSLHTLLLGSLALNLVVGIIEHSNAARTIPMWPGFWFVLGLFVVGSVLAWLGTMLAVLVASAIDSKANGLGQLVAFPVAATLGFIPLFVYAAWLGSQIRAVGGA
jgi:hypothetical protein